MVQQVTMYRASDGTTFDSRPLAERYELVNEAADWISMNVNRRAMPMSYEGMLLGEFRYFMDALLDAGWQLIPPPTEAPKR